MKELKTSDGSKTQTKDEFGVPCYYTKVTVNIWLEGGKYYGA